MRNITIHKEKALPEEIHYGHDALTLYVGEGSC